MKAVVSMSLVCASFAGTMLSAEAVAKNKAGTLSLAQQNFQTRADAWGACIMAAGPRYLESSESAEAIATAILGSCSAEQDEVRLALIPIFGLTSPYNSLQQSLPYAEAAAANKIRDMHDGFRDKIVSIVVERRTQSSRGN